MPVLPQQCRSRERGCHSEVSISTEMPVLPQLSEREVPHDYYYCFNLNRDARSSSTNSTNTPFVREKVMFQSQPRCPFFLNKCGFVCAARGISVSISTEMPVLPQPVCGMVPQTQPDNFQSQPRCPFFLNAFH